MAVENGAAELQFLHKLKSVEPPQWLIPSASRSELARAGAKQLFSILKPYDSKSPFDELLVDGFDAEQIWQQIDLQSQPVLGMLRREVKRYERNPEEFVKLFGDRDGERGGQKDLIEEEEDDEDMRELEDDDDEEEEEEEEEGREGEESEDEDEEEEDEEVEEKVGKKGGFEDKFLKMDELKEYLKKDEEREYGVDAAGKKKGKKEKLKEISNEEEDEDDEEEDEIDLFEGGADEDDDEDVKYDDFFGPKKKKEVKRKFDLIDGSEDSETDAEEEVGGDVEDYEEEDDEEDDGKKNEKLSTFQKEKLKHQAQIAEMENLLLAPKNWAMQGEVTAAQRPKDSALEIDLDFDHNVHPAPVITEEVTVSLEEMIKKRILEGRFDDVQKPPGLPTKAPREPKELDETKSKKGLGEIYEEEYVQKTNPDAAPLTFSDELKKEASMIYKKLCMKLDALSHFHFTPKPVIEDMSIQTNLPALAMEEVAPVAVSEAAMLAPEEVYDGKGDFKEETELTQAERKRRRANKKRKFKAVAAKRAPKRAKEDTVSNHDGQEAL